MGVIEIIGTPLYQWELGRKISISTSEHTIINKVEFSHDGDTESLVVKPRVENDQMVVDIPNIMLLSGRYIHVYISYSDENLLETVAYDILPVIKRPKPSDYVYTETEVLTWESLDERIKNLEKGTGGADISKEDIRDAVNEYLDNNPVSVDEKDPTVPDWAKQPNPPKQPDALSNPHKLTFSGAVSAEYDGSKAVKVVIPQGGGSKEVYELIANTTIEEAVQQWEYNFKDKPMKKIWVYIKTPAHTVDTNYASITVSTDASGASHFKSKAPYIYPIPRKHICEQDITVEVRELNGTYALVFENSPRNGQALSGWENGRFVAFGPDYYGAPLNGQMTSVKLHTYQIFDIGAEIQLWGVRA